MLDSGSLIHHRETRATDGRDGVLARVKYLSAHHLKPEPATGQRPGVCHGSGFFPSCAILNTNRH
jgi:hypothetical protein